MSVKEFLRESVQEKREKYDKIQEIKSYYDDSGYSDERLMKTFQQAHGNRKWAAGLLLKERGYGK